ncbi:DUF5996 family protein [Roseobacter sp. HKCCA0434]|uniref:DUF5996 family protein n=1 Tax=Roseobacter sp. HKCCA0434 TaxID=3079297 RepID=UPI0029058125|nr:DUF5996 family protein [Roseobacter sp. HKCCA0434]
MPNPDLWPAIPFPDWEETCTALHLWCQIVGKYRLRHTPWQNHSWHATLYVTARGLTTGPIPDRGGPLTVEFDFCAHRLIVSAPGGRQTGFALGPTSVAGFRHAFGAAVEELGGDCAIHHRPNELPEPLPFHEDTAERPYDAEAVARFHRALLSIEQVFTRFRSGFHGKVSPAHLFWGSFDFAVTRFSGRAAPPHPGGIPNLPDSVTREAYSHEVSSAGFWPGAGVGEPMFYSYAYPTPDAMAGRDIEPGAARWNADLGEFLLPYEAVRQSGDPEKTLMAFLQSTYAAAAETGDWDRTALERPLGRPGLPPEGA